MKKLNTAAFTQPLLNWFSKNARDLPWRQTPDAYRVWISEIMLQQTRVEAVKPYYARFLSVLPDIAALAAVEDEMLLKLWEGLGYYSRARNLKRAAKAAMEQFGGRLPNDYKALLTLPGIGEYTAGAIASIAYGIPEPAVDGNVLRVMARFRNDGSDIMLPATKRNVQNLIRESMPKDCPGAFNQALMELGATVCLPSGQPKCSECPVHAACEGYRLGTVMDLPVKSKKAARRKDALTVFVLRQDDAMAVRRRPDTGLLQGLWEFPNLLGHLTPEQAAAALSKWNAVPMGEIQQRSARHIFTHVEWDMRVYELPVSLPTLPAGWEWEPLANGSHALPTAFRVCMKE